MTVSPETGTEGQTYRARAWWGETLVADSSSAVLLERAGDQPALYFPIDDVRFDLFEDRGRSDTTPEGHTRLWRIDGSPGEEMSQGWHTASTREDGEDVLWRVTKPAEGQDWISEFAAFDHERVRVELLDQVGSDDPRDTTVKRFPVWGEASDLADILDVRTTGNGTYVSAARGDDRRPVVEGSQMLGQAIVAAGRHAPGRRVVHGNLVMMKAADAREALSFTLTAHSAGRTFTTVSVDVTQGDRRCATGLLLLDAMASDVISHHVPAPDVPGPYQATPYDMSVMGRDLRVVDAAYTDDPAAPVGPPVLDAWVRFGDIPDDPYIHAGLLAQFTGHMPIAAALRPHEWIGQRDAHRTLSTAINAINISLHADVRADEWMLYHHESTFAGSGMTHAECRVHNEAGGLLASFTVDAMVRAMAARRATSDERTAL